MSNTNTFIPKVGLFDATMLVAGSMIGTGVYIVGADMFAKVGGTGWFIGLWLLASCLTIIAALSYAELGVLFPFAGGQYIYLKEAYHPAVGFLYGWCTFFVIQSGTIAAVAYGFAKFFSVLNPVLSEQNILFYVGNTPISMATFIAVLSILLTTFIHTKGIQGGKKIQTILTLTKLANIALLVGCGFYFAFDIQIWKHNWHNAFSLQAWNFSTLTFQQLSFSAGFALIIPALVGAFFSNDAWYNVTFIAAEIKNPKRNIPMSLFFGTLLVAIVYLIINFLFIGIIPKEEIANLKTGSLGLLTAQKIFGPTGVIVISIMMMISALGCNNGIILAGARVYYSMAKDKLFLRQFGTLNKNRVPENALWLQGIWASLLCFSGSYGTILDYVISIVLIFFILSVIAVFIFRKKMPQQERIYKTVGYPILPLLYILITSVICIGLFIYVPQNTLFGLLLLALGLIVYFFIHKKRKL